LRVFAIINIHETKLLRYDTIRDAVLTCAHVSLIYRTGVLQYCSQSRRTNSTRDCYVTRIRPAHYMSMGLPTRLLRHGTPRPFFIYLILLLFHVRPADGTHSLATSKTQATENRLSLIILSASDIDIVVEVEMLQHDAYSCSRTHRCILSSSSLRLRFATKFAHKSRR